MFTGLITDIGIIQSATTTNNKDRLLRIQTQYKNIDLGASIACSGACMTVIRQQDDWFEVEVSSESLDKTTIGSWTTGTRINLERSLKLGDEMGGHIVSGHVDGLATLIAIEPEDGYYKLTFEAPDEFLAFIAKKGSVTLDGVALTVNEIKGTKFECMIIPHTWTHTTLCDRQSGDKVHLEIDMLARYVARLQDVQQQKAM